MPARSPSWHPEPRKCVPFILHKTKCRSRNKNERVLLGIEPRTSSNLIEALTKSHNSQCMLALLCH